MSNKLNPFVDEVFDLDVNLLDHAFVGSQLETPITEYPEVNVMLDYIDEHLEDPAVKINVKKLAKRGKAVQDLMETYLKSDHLPSSGLKEVLKNPANFFFYLNDRKRIFQEDKKHFQLGTFIHMAILEPKLFKKVKVEPKASLASLAGAKTLAVFYKKINRCKTAVDLEKMKLPEIKEYIETQKSKCKYLMVAEEHKIIIDILYKNYLTYGGGIIPKIMKGSVAETSFYDVDEQTGIKVKVRPDAINIQENIGVNAVISLKSTGSDSFNRFVNDTAKFQYELSEGMYQQVISGVTERKFDTTIMVMFQTVAPFQVAVVWWSPEDLQNGKYKYRYALDTAKECLERGLYPGYESLAEEGNQGIIKMKQPGWSHKILSPVELDN